MWIFGTRTWYAVTQYTGNTKDCFSPYGFRKGSKPMLGKMKEIPKIQGKTHRLTNKFGLKFQGYSFILIVWVTIAGQFPLNYTAHKCVSKNSLRTESNWGNSSQSKATNPCFFQFLCYIHQIATAKTATHSYPSGH